jgi:hypothetical protein
MGRLREAVEARDWLQFLSLCDRPDRWSAFRALRKQLDDPEYWRCLRYIYEDTESLWQQRDLRKLLRASRAQRETIMNAAERERLAALPEVVTVYRGCRAHNRDGVAWTLDADSARWFAGRLGEPGGILVTGSIERATIIALFIARSEEEIVADPHDVRIHGETRVD